MNTRLVRLRLILVLAVAALAVFLMTAPRPTAAQGQINPTTEAAPSAVNQAAASPSGLPSLQAITPLQKNLIVIHSALIPVIFTLNIPIVSH
jgi:hypothetical protein